MKTVKLKNLTFLLAVIFSACTADDYQYQPEETLPLSANEYVVSQDEAVTLAANAVLSLSGGDTRAGGDRTLVPETIVRYPKVTRSSDTDEPFFYIVNFEGGGYAVVPSDKRATSIYALSDNGYFDPEANEGVKLFMSLAEDCLVNETLKDTLLIFDNDNPFIIDDNIIVNVGGEDQQVKITTTKTEPFHLLKTIWGQGYPFYLECYTKKGERALTGCVATALAQIMAYHKQPQSYNGHQYYWDRMPLTNYYDGSTEAYSVAYLMSDIGKAVSMEYGVKGSLASSTKCPAALKKFGYTSTGLVNFNQGSITSSLDLKQPVYVSGAEPGKSVGHTWVIDGYFYIRYELTYYTADGKNKKGSDTKIDYYFHMNWGWNGSNEQLEDKQDERADGFFYSGVYEHGSYGEGKGYDFLYTERVKMISQIKFGN